METRVILTIPEELYRRAQQLARASNREVSEVLAESIVLEDEWQATEDAPASFDAGLAALEAAADAQDEKAFVAAYEAIDWPGRPAEDFVQAVNLALKFGDLLLARELATQGVKQYPNHAELQKMAYILAPPKARVVQGEPDTSWKANREWLKAHWDEHRGKWVALHNGELVGLANSLEALLEEVGEVRGKGILVAPVG
ncbi:MAG: hypothetical protein L0332_12850 [Chloroflexi bacterium]|nr:hypothetical protein [Chloroflexota bacterium]MCI0574974.1 hypothetical protein [Chloroflexota bacterium]MCI0648438.1 hypothetical protein [Chloroflexota bacterium]MCI0727594.1 hypothetical protein [Chloroflexota bacterium]